MSKDSDILIELQSSNAGFMNDSNTQWILREEYRKKAEQLSPRVQRAFFAKFMIPDGDSFRAAFSPLQRIEFVNMDPAAIEKFVATNSRSQKKTAAVTGSLPKKTVTSSSQPSTVAVTSSSQPSTVAVTSSSQPNPVTSGRRSFLGSLFGRSKIYVDNTNQYVGVGVGVGVDRTESVSSTASTSGKTKTSKTVNPAPEKSPRLTSEPVLSNELLLKFLSDYQQERRRDRKFSLGWDGSPTITALAKLAA